MFGSLKFSAKEKIHKTSAQHLMEGLLGFLELDPHLWRLCGPCASGTLSGACWALQQVAPLSKRLGLLAGEEAELEKRQGPLQVEVPGR